MGTRSGVTPPAPVGRDRELDVLVGLLHRVARAETAALVVHGDAGQGKSLLLWWALQTAQRRGFLVLGTAGAEFERELGFRALGAALRPVDTRIDDLPAAERRVLRTGLGTGEGEVAVLDAYGALLSLLTLVAADQPVLVVVDDAHWVDQASLTALAFAARRADRQRLGFLFAQRTGHPCVLDAIPLDRLDLTGLDRHATIELLGRGGVAPAVAARCWALTQGNPLALIEGARGLSPAQRSGEAPLPAALPVADRLLRTYRQALGRLPDATQRALTVTALETGDDVAVVADALASLGGSLDDLGPAESEDVVTLHGRRVSWRHPLLRSAAHDLADGPTRRRMHRALADAASRADHQDVAVWHLVESVVGHDDGVAAQLVHLGTAALRRGAPIAAADAFQAAADLSTGTDARHRHTYAAAEARWLAGDHARAAALLRSTIARVPDIEVRSRMAMVLGQADTWIRGPAEAMTELIRNAEHARTASRPDLAAYLYVYAASAALLDLDAARAVDLAARGRAAAEASGEAGILFGTTAIHTVARVYDGDGVDAADALERLGDVAVMALEGGADDAELLGQLCSYALAICDRSDVAEALIRRMIAQTRDIARIGPPTFVRIILTEVLWRTGRWAAGLAEITDLLSMLEAAGLQQYVPTASAVHARVLAGRGDEHGCRAAVATALDTADRWQQHHVTAVAYSALGLLELGLGRPAAAAAELDQVHPIAAHIVEPGWLWWRADAVEALAGAGRVEEARTALRRLAADATTTRRAWALAAVERLRPVVGLDAGEPDACFTRAVEGFRAIDAPFEEARTLLAQGRYRTAHDQRAAGHRDIAAARAIFDRRDIGAHCWSEQASAALADVSVDALAALTPTERAVVTAVADGATDQTAAARLGISPKTVGWHLRNVYTKLGIRRRGELIALLHEDHPEGRLVGRRSP